MDGNRFDHLVESLTRAGSRRGALRTLAGTILSVVGLGVLASGETEGKRQGKGKHRGSARNRRQEKHRQTGAEAIPANCCSGSCAPGAGLDLRRCCAEGADLSGANFRRTNLSGASFRGANLTRADFTGANLEKACFVDADITGATLTGANIKGVVFCRTRTGANSYDNSGCGRATACCPTCIALGGQRCSLGGSCCDGGAACTNDTCVCRADRKECGGVCINPATDERNCGDCGVSCPSGETCRNGICGCGTGPTCGQGLTCCAGQCVNLLTDVNNCTACGVVCPTGLANADVFCGPGLDENNAPAYGCAFLCGNNFRDCNDDWRDGCEVEIRNNNFNCGTCSPTDCAATGKECKGCQCLPPGNLSTICDPVSNAKVIRRR